MPRGRGGPSSSARELPPPPPPPPPPAPPVHRPSTPNPNPWRPNGTKKVHLTHELGKMDIMAPDLWAATASRRNSIYFHPKPYSGTLDPHRASGPARRRPNSARPSPPPSPTFTRAIPGSPTRPPNHSPSPRSLAELMKEPSPHTNARSPPNHPADPRVPPGLMLFRGTPSPPTSPMGGRAGSPLPPRSPTGSTRSLASTAHSARSAARSPTKTSPRHVVTSDYARSPDGELKPTQPTLENAWVRSFRAMDEVADRRGDCTKPAFDLTTKGTIEEGTRASPSRRPQVDRQRAKEHRRGVRMALSQEMSQHMDSGDEREGEGERERGGGDLSRPRSAPRGGHGHGHGHGHGQTTTPDRSPRHIAPWSQTAKGLKVSRAPGLFVPQGTLSPRHTDGDGVDRRPNSRATTSSTTSTMVPPPGGGFGSGLGPGTFGDPNRVVRARNRDPHPQPGSSPPRGSGTGTGTGTGTRHDGPPAPPLPLSLRGEGPFTLGPRGPTGAYLEARASKNDARRAFSWLHLRAESEIESRQPGDGLHDDLPAPERVAKGRLQCLISMKPTPLDDGDDENKNNNDHANRHHHHHDGDNDEDGDQGDGAKKNRADLRVEVVWRNAAGGTVAAFKRVVCLRTVGAQGELVDGLDPELDAHYTGVIERMEAQAAHREQEVKLLRRTLAEQTALLEQRDHEARLLLEELAQARHGGQGKGNTTPTTATAIKSATTATATATATPRNVVKDGHFVVPLSVAKFGTRGTWEGETPGLGSTSMMSTPADGGLASPAREMGDEDHPRGGGAHGDAPGEPIDHRATVVPKQLAVLAMAEAVDRMRRQQLDRTIAVSYLRSLLRRVFRAWHEEALPSTDLVLQARARERERARARAPASATTEATTTATATATTAVVNPTMTAPLTWSPGHRGRENAARRRSVIRIGGEEQRHPTPRDHAPTPRHGPSARSSDTESDRGRVSASASASDDDDEISLAEAPVRQARLLVAPPRGSPARFAWLASIAEEVLAGRMSTASPAPSPRPRGSASSSSSPVMEHNHLYDPAIEDDEGAVRSVVGAKREDPAASPLRGLLSTLGTFEGDAVLFPVPSKEYQGSPGITATTATTGVVSRRRAVEERVWRCRAKALVYLATRVFRGWRAVAQQHRDRDVVV